MSQSISYLQLDSISIRQFDGLFSLNDLHRAAGGEDKHRPAFFLRNDQTKALIEEIQSVNSQSALCAVRGGNGGTYACRELVIAYAAWISAAFHLKVIRVFLGTSQPKPAAPAFDTLNAEAMRHAKDTAQQYFNDFRAGRQAGLDIPPEVLAGIVTEALQRNRMVVTFSQEGNLNARVIAHDKWIFSTAEFIKGIENGDVSMTSEQYARTASACTSKLAGRIERMEAQRTKPRLEPEIKRFN